LVELFRWYGGRCQNRYLEWFQYSGAWDILKSKWAEACEVAEKKL
jgi:hypothetical protein